MILYIIKASLILTVCYLFYQLLLKNETFFQLNRWYFIVCIIGAFAIPLLPVPEFFAGQANWSILTDVPAAYQTDQPVAGSFDPTTGQAGETVTVPTVSEATNPINYYQIAFYVYLFGLVTFGAILLVQIMSVIYSIIRSKGTIKDGNIYIVEIDQDKSPYSFLNFIFINPEKYDWEAYNQIIEHEKVHAIQKHTVDIFLAELSLVFQWFNPFAWMYRNAVENNLEYLTDDTLVKKYDTSNRTSYQLNLVKVAVPNFPLGIATNFNQLSIKKRIKMINTKKSSIKSMWKYPFIVPVFFAAMLLFNSPTNSQIVTANPQPQPNTSFNAMDIDHFLSSFVANQDLSGVLQGSWEADFANDQVCFRFQDAQKTATSWNTQKCLPAEELKASPNMSRQEFRLNRAAGTIVFQGSFKNGKGSGSYQFEESATFRNYLESKHIKDIQSGALFFAGLTNINREYIEFLDEKGYQLDANTLTTLAFPDVNLPYLKRQLDYFSKAGYSDLSLNKIAALKTMNIGEPYFESLRELGYEEIPLDEAIAVKAMGIDIDFIKAFKEKEGRLPSFMELLAMKTFPSGEMK